MNPLAECQQTTLAIAGPCIDFAPCPSAARNKIRRKGGKFERTYASALALFIDSTLAAAKIYMNLFVVIIDDTGEMVHN
jgi:hypothetical protein